MALEESDITHYGYLVPISSMFAWKVNAHDLQNVQPTYYLASNVIHQGILQSSSKLFCTHLYNFGSLVLFL